MNDCVQGFKSFTTSRRNLGNSPVRRRCREFVDAMIALGFTCLPIKEAIELFQATLGICDRASVKGYFGTQPHRSTQFIERMARYPSGVMSLKHIELSQKVGYKPGYFELLRLATIQKKGSNWFFVLNEVSVIPELCSHTKESVCVGKLSNVEISLSQGFREGNGVKLDSEEIQHDTILQTTNIHTLQGEREKSTLDFEKPEFEKPLPKKCVACGKVDESNPYRIWCPKGGGERSKNDVCIVEAI